MQKLEFWEMLQKVVLLNKKFYSLAWRELGGCKIQSEFSRNHMTPFLENMAHFNCVSNITALVVTGKNRPAGTLFLHVDDPEGLNWNAGGIWMFSMLTNLRSLSTTVWRVQRDHQFPFSRLQNL